MKPIVMQSNAALRELMGSDLPWTEVVEPSLSIYARIKRALQRAKPAPGAK